MTMAFGSTYNINMELISFCARTLQLCALNPKDMSCLAFITYIQTLIITLEVANHTYFNMCNILNYNSIASLLSNNMNI